MGDLLMATPALSDGVMFVRTARFLFAVGPPFAAETFVPSSPFFPVTGPFIGRCP